MTQLVVQNNWHYKNKFTSGHSKLYKSTDITRISLLYDTVSYTNQLTLQE